MQRSGLIKTALLLPAIAFVLSSCTSVMNPYSSNFSCPKYYKGKCVSLPEAYNESIHNTDGQPTKAQKELKRMSINTQSVQNSTKSVNIYKQQLLAKIRKLVKQPKTPIVVPPTVMRVLILPYVNSQNELEMERYVYFFTGKPKWVFSQ
ncbi:type IV conjugative transfer system lipoprotein TraV [Hippea maritima]|uniref:Type IV conjugative transfer system protein TraV n=1 Tax=Hippea maritima (strain ATCC 700847 / DSM 10411 / MH2) TaxID=760142 RepID=F2LV26_HIPMA|nr:type IV conjugative transfer system lipoprotein TraV [Hippea maritima]AEA33610.1 Type IV conjugative transfer system protein TraV [Hippea maritima DSM 10411]